MADRQFGMIDMSITRSCNMKCKFCTAVKTHGNNKMMTLNMFCTIFDKIHEMAKSKERIEMRRKFFSFGNAGEPLLNPDFIAMNKYVKKHGWKTGVYTNGLLLTEKKMKEIYNNGGIDTINVSITGISSKVFKEFQGYGFKNPQKVLETVLNNLERVIQVRNEQMKHTKIAVNYIITKSNLFHVGRYIQYMRKIGVDEIRFTPLVDRPRKEKKIYVKCRRLDDILNIDELATLSPCNNDLESNLVIGNFLSDDWFDNYKEIVCANNCVDIDSLPETCQVCDKTNFSSFWDYMSMNFHGYLKMKNHRILWNESWDDYKISLAHVAKWYYMNRYCRGRK